MMKRASLLLPILFAACAHYPVNPPLAAVNTSTGYRYANLDLPRRDDTFVILTFSGGGSRAAGFAYGVLLQMQNTPMPNGKSMLDYIDVISSVSGGSFTAMQFGLKGADGLPELKTNFLDKDIEGMLFKAAFLNPRNWIRLLSPNFHRIDLAQELYEQELFGTNTTFATLLDAQKAKHLPLIIANSTELEIGSRFEWTQDQFDPICSDLSKVSVARAVAASSAFPGLLTPMIVNSYSDQNQCRYIMPEWTANARKDEAIAPDRVRMLIELESYLDQQRKFLHLMDGGIADNIGLRGPVHALMSTDTFVRTKPDDPNARRGFTLVPDLNLHTIKHLMFLVVTAEPDSREVSVDATSHEPSLIKVFSDVINIPMGNYSFDTIQQLSQRLQNFDTAQRTPVECQNAARQQCPNVSIIGADQPLVGYYKSIVSFPLVPNAALRERLNSIKTGFVLKPGQLDDLVQGAKEALCVSQDYMKFIQALGGTAPPCPRP